MANMCPNRCGRRFSLFEKSKILNGKLSKCDQCDAEIKDAWWADILLGSIGITVLLFSVPVVILAILAGRYVVVVSVALLLIAGYITVIIVTPLRKVGKS